uniref:Uncharacterized protein n=1 Tax=Arundo donax TaxID=35708 RepID=A0A0A9CBR5_ARUDO
MLLCGVLAAVATYAQVRQPYGGGYLVKAMLSFVLMSTMITHLRHAPLWRRCCETPPRPFEVFSS